MRALNDSLAAAALIAVLSAFSSCSQASPRLNGTDVKLLRAETADGVFEERLSVFIFWEDGDGPRDFLSLRIANDETGLEWTVDESNAAVRLRGKDRWIGSALLAPPIGESLPTGDYTVALTDLAGNEAVRAVSVPAVAFPDRSPVKLKIEGDRWTVERNTPGGDFSRVFFFLEDDEGKTIYSWRVPDSRTAVSAGTVTQLKSLARNATRVRCYAENGMGTAGVLLRPVEME